MQVHRLDADPARPGEAVDDEIQVGTEEAARQPIDLGLHPDRGILEQPAAGLDVYDLARSERLFKNVAIAVQPDDAVTGIAAKPVDEEAALAEQHRRQAAYAFERVVDIAGGGQKLVLADLNLLASSQVNRHDVTRPITAEGDDARPRRLGDEDLHAGHHALQ